ncbi:MAG TPA: tetratricopeptide repeat protein [Chloroflexota bacterium]|nr:tetratricopeptide repeat protein [Chloroflexota bacterium]
MTAPFLRFHPTLAPMLWAQVDEEERAGLGKRHREAYYKLAIYLYTEDPLNPHQARAIASREISNLLHAVHAAIAAGEGEAVVFVHIVTRFLSVLGLPRELATLAAQSKAAGGEIDADSWYMAQTNRGEQLIAAGRSEDAATVFREMLRRLPETPSYKRAAALVFLGRCFRASARPDLAERSYRESIVMLDQLDAAEGHSRLHGAVLTDLADVLVDQGGYAEARELYDRSLEIARELGDLPGQGVTLAQLGNLAMLLGNMEEGMARHRAALVFFQQLQDPRAEAVAQHQLGLVFQISRQWPEAEHHYREAARIYQGLGDQSAAARSWNQLAAINMDAGNLAAAEAWYRNAIAEGRKAGQLVTTATVLNNLAYLVTTQPDRLAEARQLAEEALATKKTLHPAASEIWRTYSLLAAIAGLEGQPAQALEYKRSARQAKWESPATRYEIRRHAPLISMTLAAIQSSEARDTLEQGLPTLEQKGWTSLAAAIRSILSGERDADSLCEELDLEASMIVEAILAGIDDPSTLQDLLPSEEE